MPFSRFEIDQPLPDGACWYRFITNTDHVTSDQTLHYQALKGNQFSASDPGKPWQHELSGAVVGDRDSADDIRGRGDLKITQIRQRFTDKGQRIPSKIRLVGLAWAHGEKLRSIFDTVTAETAYTPANTDPSHADVITFGSTSDISIDPVRHWLMRTLKVTASAELDLVVAAAAIS